MYWRPLATLLQQLETHWQLIHDAGDHGNACQFVDFFKQFEKVAKRLRGLATIGDGRQFTGNLMAIIDDKGNVVVTPPQPSVATPRRQHVANTISASVKGADRFATER